MESSRFNSIYAELVMADASDPGSLQGLLDAVRSLIEEAGAEENAPWMGSLQGAARELEALLEEGGEDADSRFRELAQQLESLNDLAEAPAEPAFGALEASPNLDLELDDEILADFLSEQKEGLRELEDLASQLADPGGEEALPELRGRLHTLKGEAGVLQLVEIGQVLHELEDVLGSRPLAEASSVLNFAFEWLGSAFQSLEDGTPQPRKFVVPPATTPAVAVPDAAVEFEPEPEPEAAIEVEVESHEDVPLPEETEASPEEVSASSSHEEIDEVFSTPFAITGDDELMGDFLIEAHEHLEEVDAQLLRIEKNAHDSEALNAVFRAFHTIKGLAGFLEFEATKRLAHEAETMLDMARSGQLELVGPALEATFGANDAMKALIGGIQEASVRGGEVRPSPGLGKQVRRIQAVVLGEALPDLDPAPTLEPTPTPDPAPASVQPDPKPESAPVESREFEVAPAEVEPAPAPRELPASTPKAPERAEAPPAKKLQVKETIKVDANRLDQLVDMIGELVIAETMVSQSEELHLEQATRLPSLISHMDKITRELQELAMSLRMVPIRSTFRRMARLARDVGSKLDKNLDFVTRGEETELDKTVVDSLGDPLVHLVRNAVDHGLEPDRESRVAAGKPPVGRVELRAFHQGGNIHIELEDDGRGLNREKILKRAIDRGIVTEEDNLTDAEIHNLIFAPGFSTAETVTDVSGRGVGMDVVRRSIEALRGSIDIRSEQGSGSVFSIKLPLTLAIIDGMVVRIGKERYVLPTVSIVRMIRPEEQDLTDVFGKGQVLRNGDELVPVMLLNELFDIPDALRDQDRMAIVIVEHDTRKFAFAVDQVLGQQQIVIKPLGAGLTGMPGFAGGAIMPDGHVGLILDIAGLVKVAEAQGQENTSCGNETPLQLASHD